MIIDRIVGKSKGRPPSKVFRVRWVHEVDSSDILGARQIPTIGELFSEDYLGWKCIRRTATPDYECPRFISVCLGWLFPSLRLASWTVHCLYAPPRRKCQGTRRPKPPPNRDVRDGSPTARPIEDEAGYDIGKVD